MNGLTRFVTAAVFVSLWAVEPAPAGAPQGSPPPAGRVLATVNGESITLRQLKAALNDAADPDPWKALERQINVTLIVQEAGRMGLDQSLEVRDQLGVFERDTLRDGLFANRVVAVKVDPKQVDALESAMTTLVSMRSILAPAEVDAKSVVAAVGKGEDFETVIKSLAAKKLGQVDEGEGFIKVSELLPEVQTAIAALKPGQVSSVYKIGSQYAVTRLIDRKVEKTANAHADAAAEAYKRAQLAAITAYVDELKAKYATVNRTLLASVDFDAKTPPFETYLKDPRPVVAIAGEKPITIGDLAGALRKRLFHGVDEAGGHGKLNRKKAEILDDLVAKRVVMKEAKRLGLDKKPEYVALRDATESELMFGAFVAKVFAPDIKVSDDEVKAYYKAHLREFTAPDMVRLEALPFDTRVSAEAALAKLRAGSDLAWMRVNAPGRRDPKTLPEDQRLPAAPVIVAELPAELRETLTGTRAGDYRLYAPQGRAPSVVFVKDFISGQPLALDDASKQISGKLSAEKLRKAFEDYAAKLKASSTVKVMVTQAELAALVGAKKTES
jgi:parvulin-like peptidyl-prolyl isomerase